MSDQLPLHVYRFDESGLARGGVMLVPVFLVLTGCGPNPGAELDSVLAADGRNSVVVADAYYASLFSRSTLVLDVTDASAAAGVDLSRVLLQFAATQKEAHDLERVMLACRGDPVFMLRGSYFKEQGRAYGTQNPVYQLRKLPENVLDLEGGQPFPAPQGGALFVVGKEMDNLNALVAQWVACSL
jgi:hypothetical protein